MLGKAANRYQASAPPVSKAQPGKPDLSKQLFPSSSPRDGNIIDLVSNSQGRGASGTASLGSSKASGQNQLHPRSSNSMSRTNTGSSVTSFPKPSDGFATLYSKADSFQEEPTTTQQTGFFRSSVPIETVYIAEDDFSDDDDLELDYECPSALPSLPPPPRPAMKVFESPVSVPPTSQTVPIPWTSSPEAHRFPPNGINYLPPKRQSPDSPAPEQPKPKKRQLPSHWAATKEDPIDLDAVAPATPAPKPKDKTMAWDTSQSALKDKRAQFKNKIKSGPDGTRRLHTDGSVPPDDIRAAVNSHMLKKNAAVSLSSEQRHVIDLVIGQGRSVFFTGPAGTGKSVLMRAIIKELKKKFARDPERVSVTASTGLAACNIGGQTLHSFAGIGLGKEDVPTLVKKIRRNQKAKNRWLRTKTLIVDEVSMVDGDLFDKLAEIARIIRNNGRPWGGIQLVITGDFFQLPPVPDKQKRDVKFAFEAATWTTSIDHTIGLTQVFRQRDPGKISLQKSHIGDSWLTSEQNLPTCLMKCDWAGSANRRYRPSNN